MCCKQTVLLTSFNVCCPKKPVKLNHAVMSFRVTLKDCRWSNQHSVCIFQVPCATISAFTHSPPKDFSVIRLFWLVNWIYNAKQKFDFVFIPVAMNWSLKKFCTWHDSCGVMVHADFVVIEQNKDQKQHRFSDYTLWMLWQVWNYSYIIDSYKTYIYDQQH